MTGKDHFQDLGINGRMNIKIHCRETGWEGLIFLRMTDGGL
jgi:hypothetical protein